VVAFEANSKFNRSYIGTDVEYYNYAAGTRNGSAFLSGNALGARVFNGTKPVLSGRISEIRMLDFVAFARRRLRPEDYVVLKMDIEDSEWTLVPALIAAGVMPLMDEMFFE